MCTNAASVILAVFAKFAGWLPDINKYEDGTTVSANISLATDTTARINAIYTVSDARNPNFTSYTSTSVAEAMLNDYITKQSKL